MKILKKILGICLLIIWFAPAAVLHLTRSHGY